MRRLIFHFCWFCTVAQWPGNLVRPQGLTPSYQEHYFDPEIEEGNTCIDDAGDAIVTETARG